MRVWVLALGCLRSEHQHFIRDLGSNICMFDPDTDIASVGPRWTNWLKRLENYFTTRAAEPNSALKKALLLHLAGPRFHELFETVSHLVFDPVVDDVYLAIKRQLATLFEPTRNKHVERFEFRRMKQSSNESLEQFATRLRIVSSRCEFTNGTVDDEITGQLIQGCFSDQQRRQVLQLAAITLAAVLERGRVHDAVESQARSLEQKESVNALHGPTRSSNGEPKFKSVLPATGSSARSSNKGRPLREDPSRCGNCSGKYPHELTCPAAGKECKILPCMLYQIEQQTGCAAPGTGV